MHMFSYWMKGLDLNYMWGSEYHRDLAWALLTCARKQSPNLPEHKNLPQKSPSNTQNILATI